ncbi:MAG: hypothetical protein ACOVQ2_03590 [Flavobacterium sp.]
MRISKFYFQLFISIHLAFLNANACEKGLIQLNHQNFYILPNTLVYTKLQVVEVELLQDSFCNKYIFFLPNNSLNKNKNNVITFYNSIDLKIKPAKKTKINLNPKSINCNNSSNSLSTLGLSNKLCVVPISNTDYKFNSKDILLLMVVLLINNIQPKKTYKNQALGLVLQNTIPFFNKPPPFLL